MAKDLDKLSLLDILPSSITGDANVQATAHSLDPEIQSVSRDIREALIISRIEELSEPIVDLLAWQLHVDFYEPDLPLAVKRRLVKNSIPMHRKKGTKWAVEEILRALGVEAKVSEWFEHGGEPYTFRVDGLLHHPLHPCESWGHETYSRVRAAIIEMKNARSWLERLVLNIVFDFGNITFRLHHALRRELRTARAAWSLWPRFDFADADAIPLDWNPWSTLRRELRTARASRGLTGVSHLDRLLRFDYIDADFLPMDIAMPYLETDTPPILVPFRWHASRTAKTMMDTNVSAPHWRRAFFFGVPLYAVSRSHEVRQAAADRGFTGVSHLDRLLRFDPIDADFLPTDISMPYFETDTPPILVPFRRRNTQKAGATVETNVQMERARKVFSVPTAATLCAEGSSRQTRSGAGSPREEVSHLDDFLHFDAVSADFAPLDWAIPYREGERRWKTA